MSDMEDINEMGIEKLREEYSLLRETLDKEEIITERLIREATRSRLSIVKGVEYVIYACSALVILFGSMSFREIFQTSWAFVIATDIMILFCCLRTYRYHRDLKADSVMTEDLLTVAMKARQLKKNYAGWIKWGMIMITVWFVWLVFEVIHSNGSDFRTINLLIGCFVGLGIGGVIGTRMDRKVMKACDDIVSQIEGNE